MRKRFVIIGSICFVITAIVSLWLFVSAKVEYSKDMSYRFMFSNRGLSSRGIIDASDGPYARFYDFESETVVPLCDRPACVHEDMDCFAYALTHEKYGTLEDINLYDGWLYFLTMEIDFQKEGPYSLALYRASPSGGNVKKLYTFPQMDFAYNMTISDGIIFLTLGKFNPDKGTSANEDYDTGLLGWYDLQKKHFNALSEKSGYGNNLQFLGYSGGKALYSHKYQTEPFTFGMDTYSDPAKFDHFLSINRMTYWWVDIDSVTETAWSEEFMEMIPTRTETNELCFFYHDTIYNTRSNWDGNRHTVEIISYRSSDRKEETRVTVDMPEKGNVPNRIINGDYFYIHETDESGNISGLLLVNGKTGKLTPINEFMNFSVAAQIESRVLLTDHISEDKAQYLWIEIDDLLSSRVERINRFS
jgi:hypothetical protein